MYALELDCLEIDWPVYDWAIYCQSSASIKYQPRFVYILYVSMHKKSITVSLPAVTLLLLEQWTKQLVVPEPIKFSHNSIVMLPLGHG